jgi:multisubunit Na+/H+ antiporter MnhG subunit
MSSTEHGLIKLPLIISRLDAATSRSTLPFLSLTLALASNPRSAAGT